MTNEELKQIVQNYHEQLWNKKDFGAIDTYINENVIIHSLLGDFQGKEALGQVVKALLVGFPDLSIKTLASLAENDLAMIHFEAHGTHLGEFKGHEPTGKKVTYAGVTLYRIQDGKVLEYWSYIDMQHLIDQIK